LNRILVVPEEFENKLNEAHVNNTIHAKWLEIGIDTVQDMIDKIISELNEKYPKLRVTDYRIENKESIKKSIENKGLNSHYSGYFETEEGKVDGLFFYIPPKLDSGNDFLTRQIIPVLFGIYKGISDRTADLHLNNRPVFIVNLNETKRSNQRAVKISFLCSELLGFRYLDIYSREFHDVLDDLNLWNNENKIKNLSDFDILLSKDDNNEYFEIDEDKKILNLLSSRITNSNPNPTAEMYRYLLRILPAIYIAVENNYRVNITDFNGITFETIGTLRSYVSKV